MPMDVAPGASFISMENTLKSTHGIKQSLSSDTSPATDEK